MIYTLIYLINIMIDPKQKKTEGKVEEKEVIKKKENLEQKEIFDEKKKVEEKKKEEIEKKKKEEKEKKEENEVLLEINEYNNKIKEKFLKIKSIDNETEKLKLYEELFDLDNRNEEYIIDYLLFLEKAKIEDKDYNSEFEKLKERLSDNNYRIYFEQKKGKRKDAREKILEFISFIKDNQILSDLQKTIKELIIDSKNEEKKILCQHLKMQFIFQFLYKISLEKNIDFLAKKKVTWENEALYLNVLYYSLLNSVNKIMEYYSQVTENIAKLPEYIEYNKKINKATSDKEIKFYKDSQKAIVLLNSEFFNYILCMKSFLNFMNANFISRFGKLELSKIEDKLLLEDYLIFIGNYIFNEKEKEGFISIWNETFVPLDKNQKIEYLKSCLESAKKLHSTFNKDIQLKENSNTLEIKDDTKIECIKNIDEYSFKYLIRTICYISSIYSLDWIKNRAIKPNYYKKNLFVCEKREIWKELLIEIFNSKLLYRIEHDLYGDKQINFFKVKSIISDIIDKIRFFAYKTNFYGLTLDSSLRIYEYGLYDYEIENKSVALLIFYGFHIVVNIHEIGGHLYVRMQYFFTSDKKFVSPKIEASHNYSDSDSDSFKNKESGEAIEKQLFGEVLQFLTIKEALYILNINNYSQKIDEFKDNFKASNNKEYSQLIDTELEILLDKLDININDIKRQENKKFKNKLSRENKQSVFNLKGLRHPIAFYYNNKKLFDTPLEIFEKKFCEQYKQINN